VIAETVIGPIVGSRDGRQWRDLRVELTSRYGEEPAAIMVCALTHDDPVLDCRDRDALVDQLRR
jgi:hypothetical protein